MKYPPGHARRSLCLPSLSQGCSTALWKATKNAAEGKIILSPCTVQRYFILDPSRIFLSRKRKDPAQNWGMNAPASEASWLIMETGLIWAMDGLTHHQCVRRDTEGTSSFHFCTTKSGWTTSKGNKRRETLKLLWSSARLRLSHQTSVCFCEAEFGIELLQWTCLCFTHTRSRGFSFFPLLKAVRLFFQIHLFGAQSGRKRNVPLGLCWIKPLTSEHPPDLDVGTSLHLPYGFSEAAPMIDV